MKNFALGCLVTFGLSFSIWFLYSMVSFIFRYGTKPNGGRINCCFKGGGCLVVDRWDYLVDIYPGKAKHGPNRSDYISLEYDGDIDSYGALGNTDGRSDSITIIVSGEYTLYGDLSKYGIRLLDSRMNDVQVYDFRSELKEYLRTHPEKTVEYYGLLTSRESSTYMLEHLNLTWKDIYID
jgi:hypothetical protein